jgi:acyl-CoA reductase-like NAD-dependent aldehyde dehydrogenase
MSDDTDMGPLVNVEGLNKIDSIVKDVVKEGAEVLTGGERIIKSKGYFYKPTVLRDVSPKMRIA